MCQTALGSYKLGFFAIVHAPVAMDARVHVNAWVTLARRYLWTGGHVLDAGVNVDEGRLDSARDSLNSLMQGTSDAEFAEA